MGIFYSCLDALAFPVLLIYIKYIGLPNIFLKTEALLTAGLKEDKGYV